MEKIAIIYSFNTNKTAQAARKITDEMGEMAVGVNAETINQLEFQAYSNYILGVPTWFDGELPNYWDEFVPAMEDMDLKGKKFAIFGNGNQKDYSENFVDGIGVIADILENRGATIVGFTSAEGYVFESSRALRNNQFCGLALDFENQGSQINSKIKKWAEQLKKEFS